MLALESNKCVQFTLREVYALFLEEVFAAVVPSCSQIAGFRTYRGFMVGPRGIGKKWDGITNSIDDTSYYIKSLGLPKNESLSLYNSL